MKELILAGLLLAAGTAVHAQAAAANAASATTATAGTTKLSPAKTSAVSLLGPDDVSMGRQTLDVEIPVHDGVRIRLPETTKTVPAEIDLELAK